MVQYYFGLQIQIIFCPVTFGSEKKFQKGLGPRNFLSKYILQYFNNLFLLPKILAPEKIPVKKKKCAKENLIQRKISLNEKFG